MITPIVSIIAATLLATTQPATQPSASVARIMHAIHIVESGGGATAPRGDQGWARGPFQIHEGYWRDSRIPGAWSDCEGLAYSRRVVLAYWRRYEPQALREADAEVLARVHNGGCGWRRNHAATDAYWAKVRKHLREDKP